MKLYVPEIGDKIKLSSDWTFDLHDERRNDKMLKHFFSDYTGDWRNRRPPSPVTLLKGTVLTVDRIYIRQGAAEYSSISFYAHLKGDTNKKGAFGKPTSPRFWATLKDCNKIEFEIEEVVVPLKLTYNFHSIREGEGFYQIGIERPENVVLDGRCLKVISARKSVEVLKVKIEYDVEWNQHTENVIFGRQRIRWTGIKRNVKFTLLTLDDKEIGFWKTHASLKSNAKKYVEKHNI